MPQILDDNVRRVIGPIVRGKSDAAHPCGASPYHATNAVFDDRARPWIHSEALCSQQEDIGSRLAALYLASTGKY